MIVWRGERVFVLKFWDRSKQSLVYGVYINRDIKESFDTPAAAIRFAKELTHDLAI